MNPELEKFAIPHRSYHGNLTDPNDLIINQNLQEFAEKTGLIAGLASNGKITLDEAYMQIMEKLTEINSVRAQLKN
jgi:hypothetical protein